MRNMSGRRIRHAAPVISTMAGGLRDHYQTTDEERAALIRRNAVILLQREAPAVVAELYPEMIDELHLCPTCGEPRVPFRAGFLKTCGRRDRVRAANGTAAAPMLPAVEASRSHPNAAPGSALGSAERQRDGGSRPHRTSYVDGMTPDTTHLLMSVSKSLTATLAGVLASRGALATAVPVTEYVEELRGSSFEGLHGPAPARHARRDEVQRGLRGSRRRRLHLRAGGGLGAAHPAITCSAGRSISSPTSATKRRRARRPSHGSTDRRQGDGVVAVRHPT
jgi:hypothetical protein